MSGLQARSEDTINGVDVREQGSALRVATNTPHLVSLGTGRLSTAVTLHPIKQGRVTIGSDPTCDIYVVGTGVASVHCRVENSHGVVTLYPIAGSLLLDNLPVDKPTRLSQGSMLTIGRSNYLRFNHPAEAKLMKSVLPSAHMSMVPMQFATEQCLTTGYVNHQESNQCYTYKELSLDEQLDLTLKELRQKPPLAPKKYSPHEPKTNIMAKVSKFEYYAKQQKIGRSQFYTNENEISPKVFSSNSLTVNTPAKDVLGGKTIPNYMKEKVDTETKSSFKLDNNMDKAHTYTNVAIKNNKLTEMVKNFDEKLPKKVNNDQVKDNIYGKINNSKDEPLNGVPHYSPVYANTYERSFDAENKRMKAYQERVKEEEKKEAEMERLEEILDIFTEYQKQLSSDYRSGGMPVTPTEKRPHNKIITNGSLPRSGAFNNTNLVKTSDGFYKFDTSQNRNTKPQRNLSSYENFDLPTTEIADVIENLGRMDEIGIPVFDDPNYKEPNIPNPSPTPYENVYVNRTVYNPLKPKSPNTNSPRSKIKTSFAHKNLSSPQYFIFPSPNEAKNEKIEANENKLNINEGNSNKDSDQSRKLNTNEANAEPKDKPTFLGIEKQLSLEEEIPMIDDTGITNDIELRYSKIIKDKEESPELDQNQDNIDENQDKMTFEDVKKELMADIPELEAFEKDLKQKREVLKTIDIKDTVDEFDTIIDVNIEELKVKYDKLKQERKKLVSEIHEIKCKMTEIRSQEDDILRELEMEKALIKGEYDSEIAILNIEQKKKTDLVERAKRIEDEIKQLKDKQELRQNEMRDRVEIATMKVERIEKDMKSNVATLDELQNAQDILDNETKIFEDLEFQHLEEESELLSNREDLQNDIILLTKKIEAQKNRILTLKSEANNNLTSALDETKVLHSEYVKLLNQVENLTCQVQVIEKELKPIVAKLNEIERAQSPDSAFYTDQTRTKSGEFGYSPQTSDSDDPDPKAFEEQTKKLTDKFNSIDQMSQSMTVDIEKRVTDSPKSKEKKGFWERNFDSLKRKKKPKSPDKVDIMSQSLNENFFYNNESIENDTFDRFNSLRNSKKKEKIPGPVKSSSSSKIPTFAALGKIIKKDSFGRKKDTIDEEAKPRYIKSLKPSNKYKSKSISPEKSDKNPDSDLPKVVHRKSCGDEPSTNNIPKDKLSDFKIPSQDDIDRISKVTIDAPIFSDDMNSLGKRTLDSLMEIERKRLEMLEEQGCQVIENEREKISELKRRAQDETKKLWDQKYREKSTDSDLYNSFNEHERTDRQNHADTSNLHDFDSSNQSDNYDRIDNSKSDFDRRNRSDRSNDKSKQTDFDRSTDRSNRNDFDRTTDKFANRSVNFDSSNLDRSDRFDSSVDRGLLEESSLMEDSFMANSTIFEESSGLLSSSIEELQVRNSRTESTEDDKRSDDSRPLSHVSDFSRDNILSLSSAPRRSRRGVAPYSECQRPLTRYLPVDRDDFDLRTHVESAGHQIDLCPYVSVSSTSCRGYLHKLGAKFHTWSKRWFVFDRETKTFVYYWDKSEKKPRGGAYFQVIEEVYLDHGNTSKSPSPQTTFIVKTRQRRYFLMAPSGEAARIWIDVIFTGAQGYTEYLE